MNVIKKWGFFLSLFIISCSVEANGGVGLGATRVIYPSSAAQVSLPVINTSSSQKFLISAWIQNEDGTKTDDFIITPPVYVIENESENFLKIVKIKDNFPNDREKIYYVFIKAIPSTQKPIGDETNNVLQLAVLSRIKLFVRPDNIKVIENLEDQLSIVQKDGSYYLRNPTPYYMNLVETYFDDKKIVNNITVSPMSDFKLDTKSVNKIKFQIVNDYGGLSKIKETHK